MSRALLSISLCLLASCGSKERTEAVTFCGETYPPGEDPVGLECDEPEPDLSSLWKLRRVRIVVLQNTRVRTLEGIEQLGELRTLRLRSTVVHDISAIRGLKKLADVSIVESPVADLSPLSSLPALRRLWLSELRPFPSLVPLGELSELEELSVSVAPNVRQPPSDLSWLRKLTRLKELNLFGHWVTDIEAVAEMPLLRSLVLTGTEVKDISVLRGLRNLEFLSVGPQLSTQRDQLRKEMPKLIY